MHPKEKLLTAFILFFLATLFFPRWPVAGVIAVSLLVGYSLFFYSGFREKLQIFRERNYLHWMLLFFCFVLVSVGLSANRPAAMAFLDPRLALFYLPLCLGTVYIRQAAKEKMMLGMALLTTAVCIYCLIMGLRNYAQHHDAAMLYNDALTDPVLGQQSIYISLLVNISIYILGYHLLFKSSPHKGWLILPILFLLFMSYLLASRTQMLALYGSLLVFIFYYIFKRKKYLEGLTLIMGLFIGVFIVYKTFPKTFNRFKELTYTQYDYQNQGPESHYNMEVTSDQWNGANFRLAAWKCGWQLFTTSPVKGVNIGDKKDRLFEVYRQKNFQFALQTKKNVHNNYLDILYSMGLIGFLLFLAGWVVLPLINSIRFHDGLSLLILISFVSAWITEIYFDRSLGGMLSGFFIPFILSSHRKKEVQP